ncbi:serine O-acetyltransferase [Caenispirillum salinarum]|uniref:serine O-acetyltransferase n=1 Tax=Caenispirillum salinarum TaxID=859058 RepID=UPI00384DCB14
MFARLKEDMDAILARDPAARSRLEVFLCYPGFHAIATHRVSHWLWGKGFRLTARFVSHLAKVFTGVEIHPGATIGRRVFIDHATGVVIGETAEVGNDVTLYQGVTLGGTSLHKGKRHPTLGDGVIVGSGAQILGPHTVGEGARIGANAVVLDEVPPGVTVVGIPARMVMRKPKGIEEDFCAYGVPTEHLPDPVVRTMDALRGQISALMDRVETLEKEREGAPGPAPAGVSGRGQRLPHVVSGSGDAAEGSEGREPRAGVEDASVPGSDAASPVGERDEEERRAASGGQA